MKEKTKTAKKKVAKKPLSKEKQYLDSWKRAQAQLENLQKDQHRVYLEMSAKAQRLAVEPLLQVADNFRAVAEHTPEDLADNAWAQGVNHVAKQLDAVLEEQGVTVIDEVDSEFNPEVHEAIETIEDKKQTSGKVVEIVQPGYILAEQVLRPAKVKVIK